ncbi:hypothetical protein QO198_18935 [Pseudoalteromonas distincta]|uniref:hypothetical protein n=1 Tax=Pseudoalteromonas distincta TaxID=77608 RepID=UPI00352E90FA
MTKFDFPVGFTFAALVCVCFSAGFIVGSSSIGSAISAIAISMLSSYIFFFLTITLKERSDKKKVKNISNPLITQITSTLEAGINNSILLPNKSIRLIPDSKTLTEEQLYNYLTDNVLNAPISGLRTYYPRNKISAEIKTNSDELILNTTSPIKIILGDLKPYLYLLDINLVKLIYEIEHSNYMRFCGDNLEHCGRFTFNKEDFIEFFILVKKLKSSIGQ